MREMLAQLATRSDPRFKSYFAGKHAYEDFIRETPIRFDDLTVEDFARAAHDRRLIDAEASYREAIKLSQQARATKDEGIAFHQLGLVLHRQGKFTPAHVCFTKAIGILQNLPQLGRDLEVLSDAQYHLGILEVRHGQIDKATRLLGQSAAIDRERGDLFGVSLTESVLEKIRDRDALLLVPGWQESPGEWQACSDEFAAVALDDEPVPASDQATAASAPESRTKSVDNTATDTYSPIQDVIWLLSHSVEANDFVMEQLNQLGDDVHRKISVGRAAFSDPEHTGKFNELAPEERLAAAILIIERDSLFNEDFRHWASWCVENVGDQDDFRLFVYFYNTNKDEVRELAGAHSNLFYDLEDTVQMTDGLLISELRKQLASYLLSITQIRARARGASLNAALSVFFGRIALFVEVCCASFLVVASIFAMILGRPAVAQYLHRWPLPIVAIVAAASLFPLSVTLLFALMEGPVKFFPLLNKGRALRWWLFLGLVFAPAAVWLPYQAGAPTSWILLGVLTGIALDTVRRSGRQARRSRISLQICKEAARKNVDGLLATRSAEFMKCPLFPSPSLNVFISYTRSSEWSKDHAVRLYRELQRAGVDCFIDHQDIGEGSSWRRLLNQSIARANIFVGVLDDHGVQREWVAAELIAALVGKGFTGLPEIILMTKPSVLEMHDRLLPVFRSIFSQPDGAAAPTRPRIIPVNEYTIQALGSGLANNVYHTTAVLPASLAAALNLLAIPFAAVGSMGAALGIVAGFFALLERWGKVSASGFLTAHNVFKPAYLLGGLCLGFTVRLAVGSRFELNRPDASGVAKTQFVGAVGLALSLGVFGRYVPPLFIGWALGLCYLGWEIAAPLLGEANRKYLKQSGQMS